MFNVMFTELFKVLPFHGQEPLLLFGDQTIWTQIQMDCVCLVIRK